MAGRQLEISEVEELISKGAVGPLQGFRSKQGFPFAAIIKMGAEFKPEFDFGNDQNEDGEDAAPVDFTGKEPLGKCPKCGGRVFDAGMNYVCEKATGADKTCTFKTGKIILQQTIEAGAGEEIAGDRQNRFAHKIYLQEKQSQVQGVSGFEGWRDGV